MKEPDRKINFKDLKCGPGMANIAFDATGNLWMSSPCQKKVYKITKEQLQQSGDLPFGIELSTTEAPYGLAFDKNGNLFVGEGNFIARFDAAQLAANAAMPAATIEPQEMNMAKLPPQGLAFDKDGNLWGYDFGSNIIYKVLASDLTGSGNKVVIPPIQIAVSVGALLEGMAFDESGGLWLTYSQGKFARISETQLTMSFGPGMPVMPERIITSADLGSTNSTTFFPAPSWSPIYAH
jgi:sugar lactone lactonase YvrE